MELGANEESAADVIQKLGNSLNRKISFQCVLDADAKTYYLAVKGLPGRVPSGK